MKFWASSWFQHKNQESVFSLLEKGYFIAVVTLTLLTVFAHGANTKETHFFFLDCIHCQSQSVLSYQCTLNEGCVIDDNGISWSIFWLISKSHSKMYAKLEGNIRSKCIEITIAGNKN